MKNVYNDYKIENDTIEAAEAAEQENPLPQFKAKEEKPKPVTYDEKGDVYKRQANGSAFFCLLSRSRGRRPVIRNQAGGAGT